MLSKLAQVGLGPTLQWVEENEGEAIASRALCGEHEQE